MTDLKACKKYADCDWRKSVGYCLDECNHFKHKDEVVVVRCKYCKFVEDMAPIENSGGCLMGECTLRKEDDIVFMVFGDDFCSYGERRN